MVNKKMKSWYEYLYFVSLIYLFLGIFNILFAWIGIICFIVPLIITFFGGGKIYCNKYCGRGQLFYLLGTKYKLSRNKPMPNFLKSKWFRYGFLAFFMFMFGNMIFSTYLVFAGTKNLKEVVTILWTWKMPWQWVNTSFVSPWIAQFAFGFYSIMLTSTILGVSTMLLYKPRSWCVYCPMGTMTQGISKLKYKNKIK
ncbi:4Fe-4S binding protein [Clostridium sp. SYSU_GA19001]|uniref:4Fe-4S binding protein n=1 Tax=Clostridium caldaquaticum TaxID=2940653 RepID=UPI0020773DCB|nr:4Fe-4S binding protein [Clostridium caldaquaticum]MCM8711677.1 4Fe-4S binding protein [Clostridium caldaquaticum]